MLQAVVGTGSVGFLGLVTWGVTGGARSLCGRSDSSRTFAFSILATGAERLQNVPREPSLRKT